MLAIIVILLLVLALIVVQASRPKHAESKKNDITSSEDAKGREIRDELTKSNPSFKRRRDLGRVAMNVALVDIKDIPVFEKTDKESEFITECLRGNFIFSQVTDMSEVVSAFEKHVVPDGEIVIKEGDDADYFYLIESGDIEFFIKDKPVGVRGEGEDFGDLALLRNCKRAATCVASGECVLWRLEQKTYRAVMAKNRTGRLTALVQMLNKIPLFTSLNDHLLEKIAATLVEKKFAKDDILMKKGDIGSEMLIIKSGKVLLRDIEAKGRKYDDVELKTGDFFGERSVLESEPRAATAVAIEDSVMFCLSKESFVKHIGSMDQLKRDATYLRLLKSIKIFADSDISPPEYEEIISRIKNVSVEKGTVIYTENDNNKNIYLIESGEVTVSSESKSERSEKMHFGDDHFLHSYKKAPETVTAKVDTAMGVLSVDSLVTVIRAIARLNSKDPKARWRRAILKVQAMNRIGRMVGGSAGKDFDTIRTASKVPTELSALHRHRILGIGAFGKVWLVSPKNDSGDANKNKVYALKVQKKRQLLDNKMSTAVIREASIMKSLDHPFVMSLHNVYQDGTSVYFLTNFIRGGELFRVLNEDGVGVAIPNDDARFYAAGVFEGLNHMHTRGILYRDLKPENVLIGEDGYPVLVDLGFAKKLVEGKAFTMCGSPYYIAPEVLLGTGHDKSFDHWAWAIMVHEMLSGDVPFKDSAKASQIKLFKAIAKGRFKISDILNESAIDLVKKILVTDVAERLGSLAGGVRDIKSHDWFEGIDFDAVGNKSVTPPWVPDVGHALDCSEFEDFSHEEFEEEPNHLDVLTDAENALFNDLDEIMNGRFEVSL